MTELNTRELRAVTGGVWAPIIAAISGSIIMLVNLMTGAYNLGSWKGEYDALEERR